MHALTHNVPLIYHDLIIMLILIQIIKNKTEHQMLGQNVQQQSVIYFTPYAPSVCDDLIIQKIWKIIL